MTTVPESEEFFVIFGTLKESALIKIDEKNSDQKSTGASCN